MTFASLGLRPELLESLAGLGYEEPTPIQESAVPVLLSGSDLLGQAATGTGKTAAFALPLLQQVADLRDAGERRSQPAVAAGLVLVPTRELCVQVSQALQRYGRELGVRTLPVYGGQPVGRQVGELRRGVDLVVATPGRATDLLERGALDLSQVRTVVLDEADEMLDMGFADELEQVLDATPSSRQTVLFSATMPRRLEAIAARHLRDPQRIRIERERPAEGEAPQVREVAYLVDRAHKPAALGRLLDLEQPVATIVFCRTRDEVEQVTEALGARGYRAEALHGGMSQEQRDRVMGRLRSQAAELLVATDVAARGLDIDHLSHVVHYDVPSAPESYVHRSGRVGRGGREGVALTLATPRERRQLQLIEQVTGRHVPVQPLPSVADLRARRLEDTATAVREALGREDLDGFRDVVEQVRAELPAGTGTEELLLAAVAVAAEQRRGAQDEEEIPQLAVRPWREDGGRATGGRDDGGRRSGPARVREERDGPAPGKARLYVGAGRAGGIRPQDLVGAIANESTVQGRDIGPIVITERFSLVDVPAQAAADVIHALQHTRVKGRKVQVRRDRGEEQQRGSRGPRPRSSAPTRQRRTRGQGV